MRSWFITATVFVVGMLPIMAAVYDRISYNSIPVLEPSFKFVQGTHNFGRVYVVFDGFVGHPERRLAALRSPNREENIFVGHSVLYVNPQGDRYDMEVIAQATANWLKSHDIRFAIPVGLSLGAKVAYRLIEILRESTDATTKVYDLKLIDPLFEASGIKNPLAKWIAKLKPGKLSNKLLSRLVTRVIAGKPTNPHQEYSRTVKLSRIADESRASVTNEDMPFLDGMIVTIIHVHPDDDGVLSGQVEAWSKHFETAKNQVETIQVPRGTHHLGMDTEPEIWRQSLIEGLAPAF